MRDLIHGCAQNFNLGKRVVRSSSPCFSIGIATHILEDMKVCGYGISQCVWMGAGD